MDEDIITIHLGKVLPKDEYDAVVKYICDCMQMRYPGGNFIIAS